MILNYQELCPLFETIIKEFNLKGKLVDIRYISTGNINDTYVAVTDGEEGIKQYIMQRVNHHVFKEPVSVAENICKVTAHIENKLIDANVPDFRRRYLRYFRKSDGAYFYITDEGDYWRVLSFVFNAVSIDSADIPHLRETGIAFGEFQNYLADFPAESLFESIPDFHNTKKRYEALRAAAEADVKGRLSEVREEYDYILSMEPEATVICELDEQGKLPKRVVHNDTKCNNVMFDITTGEHLAVIDLDTVMPGFVAHDFGDAVRFAANPGGEDNPDVTKVYLDLDYYSAFVDGFVPCVLGKITDLEIETLPDGVLVMTLELAARFLTDYLNGDVYFKCKMPRHNLVRTKAQIALAKDIHYKMPELKALLKCITDRYKV